MSSKYDIESFLADLQSCLATNLNTTISAINAEKNDGITLKTVDSGAYHLQTLGDRFEASDPFIVYGENEPSDVDGQGPFTAIKYHLGIELCVADNGADANIVKRLFRYRRAIEDTLEQYWDSVGKGLKIKIKGMLPSPPFKGQDSDYVGRAVGVTIETTIA